MSWSSNSSLTVVRDGMWGFLLFAGAAWLTIAWSVLRLEPTGIAAVAGAVVLFGAVTEALRALAGTRAWWLNAAMAALFTVTGVLLLVDRDSSFTTPSALIGWYLMVRGTVDVAVSTINRVADRVWGLTMVLGVLQVGLGFFAASRYSRTAEVVVVVLGALALIRAVADLVASLMLRETATGSSRPREKAAGLAGYAAGLADFAAAATARSGRPRHRATGLLGTRSASSTGYAGDQVAGDGDRAAANPVTSDLATADLATADLDAVLALAGVSGAVTAARPAVGGAVTAARPAVAGAVTAARPAAGGSSAPDGMVAATMFTGPHHTDGRSVDGDAAVPAGSGMTGDAPGGTGPGDGVAPGGTGRRGKGRSGATAVRSDRTAAARSDRTAAEDAPGGSAASRVGGLAARTARLFGRARRDTD